MVSKYGSMHKNLFFRRCVEGCDQYGSPACPVCPAGQICSLLAPTCDECQRTVCVAQSAAPATISTTPKSSSIGPHDVSAIAGGVIGGLIAVAGTTYLVWRFFIKRKRQRFPLRSWAEETDDSIEAEKPYSMRTDARFSTHTTVSTASTAFTRASNIIQIAYIPGVMDRSTPSTPSFLVPPVPPIPLTLSSSCGESPSFNQEHFFMPGDLRDSTYSARTSRTSFERHSIASTAYGKNAIVSPVSAQTGIRGKAAMVSVRSNPPSGDVYPVAANFDYSKFNDAGLPSPAFSVGSTFLSHASAATRSRAKIVQTNSSDGEEQLSPHPGRSLRGSQSMTFFDDAASGDEDSNTRRLSNRMTRSSMGSLSAVIQDATRKAAMRGPTQRRTTTPFGDEHEMR